MINEFKTQAGTFKDRDSGKTIIYAEATDKQVEEKIADDFADFRNGKIPAKSLSGRCSTSSNEYLSFLNHL